MPRFTSWLLIVFLLAALTTAPFEGTHAAPSPIGKEMPKEITNSIGMKLVLIPAGEFMMGAMAEDDGGGTEEKPRHKVKITKVFYLGIHEVTQGQFKAVMRYNPSFFARDGQGQKDAVYLDHSKPGGGKDKLGASDDADGFPVENVSWHEAKEFCEKLSALGDEKKSRRVYRLPTEAEWEYSCRAGDSSKKYHFGDELTGKQANFLDSRLRRTCSIGSYTPNAFGLHDMHGNVREWCSDWYDSNYYSKDNKDNPAGPTEGSSRMFRGGCWLSNASGCRSANRSMNKPTYRGLNLGFRVALVPPR